MRFMRMKSLVWKKNSKMNHCGLHRFEVLLVCRLMKMQNLKRKAKSFLFWGGIYYWEAQELSKIIDEKSTDVFKKYDLLKALND